MDLGLGDRVFVVTAASGGLGRATAEQLVAEGARVVLVARRADVLADAVAGLGPGRAVAVTADLADPATAGLACLVAVRAFGRLDGALVSTGGPPAGSVLGTTDEQWGEAFDSVFRAVLRVSRAVVAHATTDEVALAWVLSSSVLNPVDGLATSNGLRPGLGMLVKQLADEVGPSGTRVVGLLPGKVDTDRVRSRDAAAGDPAAVRVASEAGIPLRRYGSPAEFARVAAFVLSPAASYLTGCVVPVDGGALRSL